MLREIHRAIRQHHHALAQTGPEKEASLHELRKIAKRVRYGAEVLALGSKKSAPQLASSYEDLQEILGRRHDAVMTKAFLESEAQGGEEFSSAVATLCAHEDRRIAETDDELTVAWKATQRRRIWSWLE